MQVLLFPSHFKYSPFCLFSLSVVTQIQGHIASCSPPLTGVRIYEIFILCYEGKAQIVQTNWKLRVRNRSQNGQQHEQWDRPPRRLAYTYLHDSAALSWRVLLYYAYADGSQFTVSSPLLDNITNPYPVGPFAQYLWEVCSLLFPAKFRAVFAKHAKQETIRLKTV